MHASSIRTILVSALAGWLSVLAVIAAFTFGTSHSTPELGSREYFFLLALVFTLCYVVAFVLVILPTFFLFGARVQRLRFLSRACIGTVLLGGCVALFAPIALNSSSPGDFVFILVLASAAGFACFAAVPHPKDG